MNLPFSTALKPICGSFFRSIFIAVLFVGTLVAEGMGEKCAKAAVKPPVSRKNQKAQASCESVSGLTKISLFEGFDGDFKRDVRSANIDVLLENMVKAAQSPSTTMFESECFARSGELLVEHYSDLSARQKSVLLQCLTI